MKEKLKMLGLSDYEIKAYLTLVKYGSLNGNNLSKYSFVPQGKIYLTMEKLSEKGLVSIIDSKPKIFKAVDPKIAVSNLLSAEKEKIEKLEKELPVEINNLKKIELKKQETNEKITILKGKKNAFPIAYHLYESAKKSIDVMLTFEYVTTTSKKLLLKAQKNKVKIRILATKEENKKEIREMVNLGFDVRYYPVDELRILIKDNDECIQMIVNPRDLLDRTNIYIQSKELTNALQLYFDKLWKKAKKI